MDGQPVQPPQYLLRPYCSFWLPSFAKWYWDRFRKKPKVFWTTVAYSMGMLATVTASFVMTERILQHAGIIKGISWQDREGARKDVTFTRQASLGAEQKAHWDKIVRQVAFAGDFSPSQFWRAARRTRPVELELCQAEQVLNSCENSEAAFEKISQLQHPWAKQVIEAKTKLGSAKLDARAFTYRVLAMRWELLGWLDDDGRESMFGSRYTIAAEGQDIGFTVDPWLGTENLISAERERAVKALDKQGFFFMKNALSKDDVQKIQELLNIDISSTSPTAVHIDATDKNVKQERFTIGRMHSLIRGSSLDSHLRFFHKAWMPVIQEYMSLFNESGFRQPFVSEVQLLNSGPLSKKQGWHLDNRGGGITVAIPLRNISKKGGTQELIPGSHKIAPTHNFRDADSIFPSPWRMWKTAQEIGGVWKPNENDTEGKWLAGDALVFDARLGHRATLNSDFCTCPVLFIRYDFTDAPTPGLGRFTAKLYRYFLQYTNMACKVRNLNAEEFDLFKDLLYQDSYGDQPMFKMYVPPSRQAAASN